ncbi:hypothetical protein O181_018783 [Austropuccinia psidii MF-1]|uniref:Uncharacterized protein n=1 Tax=Austropuccinia psidii MF-1 TaxID=1389203 RepID=A0A9Q3C9Q9_9BASI|nr:hypothetical protein [Austropuccinia psidii MF-1]
MLVMLSNKHTKKACLLCDHSNHMARGVPTQDAVVRTALWLKMMKKFPNGNRLPDGNASGRLAPWPQVLIFPPPLHDWSEVIFWPMRDGNGERTFELGPIVTMGFKCQNTPIPCMPRKQTPGPSDTRWLEDLFREPSHANELPIPGPSQSSKPHEQVPTSCPTAPRLVIIIDDTPVSSPAPPPSPPLLPQRSLPTSFFPHSHNEAFQEFSNLKPTLMINQEIVHGSINGILLEYR